MKVSAAGLTDMGRVRDRNEDFILVDWWRRLYVVADGMGGRPAGALASETAARKISEALPGALVRSIARARDQRWRTRLARKALICALQSANRAVLALGTSGYACQGMASTVLVGLLIENHLYTAHAGDVRAYLVRGGAIRRLTRDHSVVEDLLELGRIDPDQARTHPKRHLVTKAIGAQEDLEPGFVATPLRPRDWIVLCSDGLWNLLEEDEILAELAMGGPPEDVTARLIEKANSAGGHDNIACVAIACGR